MSSAEVWKKQIVKCCKEAGTMNKAFRPVIDSLAVILEQRDLVWGQFEEEGKHYIVERVSDRGAVNSAKNPLFVTWCDLNNQALSYWKEMGLTARGLKAITDSVVKEDKEDPLDKVLAKLGR